MSGPSIHRAVQLLARPVFTTSEVAALRGASGPATSQALQRMAADGVVTQASRGVWAVASDPRFTPYALVPLLAGNHLAYVSFLSALRLYGIIEQIPQVVYAATTGRTRLVTTALGVFSFHHLDPRFFCGFDWYGTGQAFLIAEQEKALVDCLYLSSRRGRRFRHLPELTLGKGFSLRCTHSWLQRIQDRRLRAWVASALAVIGGGSDTDT